MMWPWLVLLLLGVGHGVNPGMGWLFAVALGLQEKERRAVWRALLPLALGHALAIAVVIVLASAVGLIVPVRQLEWMVAATLIGLGTWRLVRHRHLRWGGMRMSMRDLAIWSFLMATAHGAGLMALPFAIEAGAVTNPTAAYAADHLGHMDAAIPGGGMSALIATLVHAFGYLLVTGLLAVVVYEWVGLRLLRRVWVNVDLVWGVALVGTGVVTLLV
ncbi:MAG TPA: hypothetical protein VJ596_05835 [Gemmatimonadaceae bacterium]|nr:hypothetical protein [Gemmatimonadaceae bacterium]